MQTFDLISLIVSIASFALAILVFIISERENKEATEKQTHEENVRATLTDFSNLRRPYQEIRTKIEASDEKGKRTVIKNYIRELERFAVGCNIGAYDLEVVNKMSGGTLLSDYNMYLRQFIQRARRELKPQSLIRPEALYSEVELMIRNLCGIRHEKFQEVEMLPEDVRILERFLALPVDSPEKVFEIFRTLEGCREAHGDAKQGYLYIPGTRLDRCLLVAHADTYFDTAYGFESSENHLGISEERYYSNNEISSIGADDRCGCAMLWLLRNSGHSLLILDGEEHGQKGAHFLMESDPALFDELNSHTFMLQLDRRNSRDLRYYDLPVTDEFKTFIEAGTGYENVEGKGRTDICVLCRDICAANISVGYYNEHTKEEYVEVEEWQNTLDKVRSLLEKPLIKYLTK